MIVNVNPSYLSYAYAVFMFILLSNISAAVINLSLYQSSHHTIKHLSNAQPGKQRHTEVTL